ncbi:MAG: OmpA family protein [Janthinobacterium lividum]
MNLHRTSILSRAILPLTLAALAVTGCHKKTAPVSPNALPPAATGPTPTASITADPQAIDLGQSVVLNWRTTNANKVSIDGIGDVAVNGTQTVSPANSTNFHLVATGDGGITEANVRVTVRVPQVPGGNAGNAGDNGAAGSDAAFHAAVQDIFFGYDSYDLQAESQTTIASSARYLEAHPGIRVVIAGYCDDRGSAEYNITLGENRANSAKEALVSAGLSPDRIRVVSYGKERQFCTEEAESCYQQNRRDQFTIDR